MGALAGLVEQEARASGDDLLAELDEGDDEVAQVEHLGSAAVQRDEIAAEEVCSCVKR